METIKINDMQTKGVVFIVKYLDKINMACEATLNINFNKQEIWYLENEVGIGGTVSVLITPSKCGRYINIKAVDMNSAVKGDLTGKDGECMACGGSGCDRCTAQPKPDRYIEIEKTEKFRTPKEMTANNLTDIFCRNQQMDEPKYVLDTYNYFLGEL